MLLVVHNPDIDLISLGYCLFQGVLGQRYGANEPKRKCKNGCECFHSKLCSLRQMYK